MRYGFDGTKKFGGTKKIASSWAGARSAPVEGRTAIDPGIHQINSRSLSRA
jgi:hypothetical protein